MVTSWSHHAFSEVCTEQLKALSKIMFTHVLKGGLFHYFDIFKLTSADSEHSDLYFLPILHHFPIFLN